MSMKSAASDPGLPTDGPRRAACTIILAHGAGVGMDTEFMTAFAEGLAKHDLRVVRFEFPYMAARRETGKNRPPDREPVLRDTWQRVIDSPSRRIQCRVRRIQADSGAASPRAPPRTRIR